MLDLKDIAKQINITIDNALEEEAIFNVLQAKLCSIFSFKNIKFSSVLNSHESEKAVLSYYAFNFVPSGGTKNVLLKKIDKILLPFFKEELDIYHEHRKTLFISKQQEIIHKSDKLDERDGKKLVAQQAKELLDFDEDRFDISFTLANQTEMYRQLKIIKDAGYGSALVKSTEFASFFECAILKNDMVRMELINSLFDLYDGEFTAVSAVSNKKKDLEAIPFSAILMSDYDLILNNNKLSAEFKGLLKRGIARRSFIYYKKISEEDFLKEDVVYDTEYKDIANEKLDRYSEQIKEIYKAIRLNQEFEFSAEANETIREFKKDTLRLAKEFNKYSVSLDLNLATLQVDMHNSSWKVAKLALFYHLISSYDKEQEFMPTLIKSESVKKAINFFYIMHNSLRDLMLTNPVSDFDKIACFLTSNLNKWQSLTVLRKQDFVHKDKFSNWIKIDAPCPLATIAEEKGLKFAYRDTVNRGMDFVIYDPEKYIFNYTVTNVNNKKIVEGDLVDLSKTGLIEIEEI